MTRPAILVLTLVLGLASTAHPQTSYRDYLERQLNAIAQTLAASGYQPSIVGTRNADEMLQSWVTFKAGNGLGLEVVLESGTRYRIGTEPYDWDDDDCGKSIEDAAGNTILRGVWSEDRYTNLLDFIAPASGTHILVVNCPEGSPGFWYDYEAMAPTGYFERRLEAYPADMTVGFLRSGTVAGLSILLEEGVEYLIAGVCDQDCTDLDLSLTGEDDDTILFKDDLDDDAPVLQFVAPNVDVAFTLWVTMYACSVEPCSFAYQVYRR